MTSREEVRKFQTEEGRKFVAGFVAESLAEEAAIVSEPVQAGEQVTPWWELSGMEREIAKYDQCEEPGDCDHDRDNAIEYFREQELNELRERAEKAEAEAAWLRAQLAEHESGPILQAWQRKDGSWVHGNEDWIRAQVEQYGGAHVIANVCTWQSGWRVVGVADV